MSSDDERKRLNVDVNADDYEMAMRQLDRGELSEIVRDVVQTLAYGAGWDRTTVLDRRVETGEAELRKLRERRRQADAAIETKEEEVRELRRRREQTETQEEQFKGALWSAEQSFRAGDLGHLSIDHPVVSKLAERYGRDATEVLETFIERNPDVPEVAFEGFDRSLNEFEKFRGVPDDEVDVPVEARRSL